MLPDLTPREYLALEQQQIKNGFESIFDFLGSLTVNYNGKSFPYKTPEELAHRKEFPLLGKLMNNFEAVYATLSKINGGLDFLALKDAELAVHIETGGKGNPDSMLLRWFNGCLDDGFYGENSNEQHFFTALKAGAAVMNEPASIQQLAAALDQFAYDQDYYEYGDRVEDRAAHVAEMEKQLSSGNVASLTDYLLSYIEEAEEPTQELETALRLLAGIDKTASAELEKLAADRTKAKPGIDEIISSAAKKVDSKAHGHAGKESMER